MRDIRQINLEVVAAIRARDEHIMELLKTGTMASAGRHYGISRERVRQIRRREERRAAG